MIREITVFPALPSVEFAVDVRTFDEKLFSFIDDLKDTITEHNLLGLSATQVGSYYSVAVVKQGEDFLELINPRVLSKKGKHVSLETTAYFGDKSAQVNRYDEISLVYEDRQGAQHSLKSSGDFSVLLQRKIDYLYGANFLTKMSEDNKEKFERSLKSNLGDSCPTQPKSFSRDLFVHGANYLMIAMLVLLFASLFVSDEVVLLDMWMIQLYMSFSVISINVAYILYSYYENKRFSICTNCYNMSILGVAVISFVRLSILMIVSYFIINS
ncbi:MAG: peptide deformylase [Sulfurimonas sp.]